jgi:hypothetical protein
MYCSPTLDVNCGNYGLCKNLHTFVSQVAKFTFLEGKQDSFVCDSEIVYLIYFICRNIKRKSILLLFKQIRQLVTNHTINIHRNTTNLRCWFVSVSVVFKVLVC